MVIEQSEHKDCLKFYTEDIDENTAKELFLCDVEEIPKGLDFFTSYGTQIFPLINWVNFRKEFDYIEIDISIIFNWETWKQPITIQEFLENYKYEMSLLNCKSYIEKDENWASLNLIVNIKEGVLKKTINEIIRVASDVYNDLLIKVVKNTSEDVFVKVFDFPEGYESVCTQYLVWFGDFLSSFGIEASVSAENNGINTSIIVSPKDMPNLVGDIEKLFYTYLSLPYSEYLPKSNDLSVIEKANFQLLQNNVENFKNQITMKDAIIEMKDISIAHLNDTLEQKKTELLLIQSMKNSKDLEILDGVITIEEIKLGAIKLNLNKLIGKIKKKV